MTLRLSHVPGLSNRLSLHSEVLLRVEPSLVLKSVEKLLGVAPDLGATAGPNVGLDLAPILPIEMHG